MQQRIQPHINLHLGKEVHLAICMGFFDGVHRGHQHLLNQLKEEAEKRGLTPAILTFSNHPSQLTAPNYAPAMLQSYNERIESLRQTGIPYVFVLTFDQEVQQMSAISFMEQIIYKELQAKLLVMGFDSRFGKERYPAFETYEQLGQSHGVDVIRANRLEDPGFQINSSSIRKALGAGEIERANYKLGYTYFIEGKVINGFKLGRTLGFPTANLQPHSPPKLIPKAGVYLTEVEIAGRRYYGMTNIGVRPTIANSSRQSIETFIFDFQEEIYGETLRVHFLHYLRPEQKMASREHLIEQLERDQQACLDLIEQGLK